MGILSFFQSRATTRPKSATEDAPGLKLSPYISELFPSVTKWDLW